MAPTARCEVYGIPLGAGEQGALVKVAGELRRAGVRVDLAYGGRKLKTAMKAADAAGARWVLLLGDRELAVGEVTVRDMVSGDQQAVPLAAVAGVLAQRLTEPGPGR